MVVRKEPLNQGWLESQGVRETDRTRGDTTVVQLDPGRGRGLCSVHFRVHPLSGQDGCVDQCVLVSGLIL